MLHMVIYVHDKFLFNQLKLKQNYSKFTTKENSTIKVKEFRTDQWWKKETYMCLQIYNIVNNEKGV